MAKLPYQLKAWTHETTFLHATLPAKVTQVESSSMTFATLRAKKLHRVAPPKNLVARNLWLIKPNFQAYQITDT